MLAYSLHNFYFAHYFVINEVIWALSNILTTLDNNHTSDKNEINVNQPAPQCVMNWDDKYTPEAIHFGGKRCAGSRFADRECGATVEAGCCFEYIFAPISLAKEENGSYPLHRIDVVELRRIGETITIWCSRYINLLLALSRLTNADLKKTCSHR